MPNKTAKKVVSRLKRPTYQRTFIKEWREFRDLTQDQLAAHVGEYLAERGLATGYSYATIGRLENGKVRYTQPVMEGIADALRCTVADLITVNPKDPAFAQAGHAELLAAYSRADAADRLKIVEVAKTIAGKSGG